MYKKQYKITDDVTKLLFEGGCAIVNRSHNYPKEKITVKVGTIEIVIEKIAEKNTNHLTGQILNIPLIKVTPNQETYKKHPFVIDYLRKKGNEGDSIFYFPI